MRNYVNLFMARLIYGLTDHRHLRAIDIVTPTTPLLLPTSWLSVCASAKNQQQHSSSGVYRLPHFDTITYIGVIFYTHTLTMHRSSTSPVLSAALKRRRRWRVIEIRVVISTALTPGVKVKAINLQCSDGLIEIDHHQSNYLWRLPSIGDIEVVRCGSWRVTSGWITTTTSILLPQLSNNFNVFHAFLMMSVPVYE